MDLDLVIAGGTVHDGLGSGPRRADVGVAGGRVAAVGDLSGIPAAERLDAGGRIVCPGFIDTHAHSEFTLLADPRAEGKLRQGVTTEIIGNCGLSAGPLLGACAERREADLREFGIPERWTTLEEYFRILEGRGPALNVASLAGHGNLRASVVGYADRPADEGERRAMRGLLAECMAAGALGISTGLIYPPGLYTPTDEIVELSREAASRGGIYATHMRSEGDGLVGSVEEALEIGRRAGIPVHISHLKTYGRRNWHKLDAVLERIGEARRAGLPVTADRYPYTAAATDLDALLPAWVFEGGASAELERLGSAELRRRIAREMEPDVSAPGYWSSIRVSGVGETPLRWMVGLDLETVARREGKAPLDALFDILVRDRLRTGAIFFAMNEENLVRILKQGYTMIGSDASARGFDGPTAEGRPHPRAFGTFPRFLGRYVIGGGILKPEEAIHRMTGLPASVFGLEGRGVLREGAAADILVLDPETFLDGADFDEPFVRPAGLVHLFVNGEAVIRGGGITGRRPGRVLRRGVG